MAYQTTNPYTGEILKTFPDATDAEVAQALERGHAHPITHKFQHASIAALHMKR